MPAPSEQQAHHRPCHNRPHSHPSTQIQDKMVFAHLLSQCSHDTLQFVLLLVCIHNFMLIALILASPLIVAKVKQIIASLDQVYWVEVVKATRSVVDACCAALRAAIATLNASITLLAAEKATFRKEQEELHYKLRNDLRDDLRKVYQDMAGIKAVVHKLAKDAKDYEYDRWAQLYCTENC